MLMSLAIKTFLSKESYVDDFCIQSNCALQILFLLLALGIRGFDSLRFKKQGKTSNNERNVAQNKPKYLGFLVFVGMIFSGTK